MEYGIHSRDYLRRARQRLDERSPESLFYACLELRLGIEARLHQYLEAQIDISEKKKRGWRIPQLARNLEEVFGTGDRVVEISIHDSTNGSPLYVFYYTPVGAKLTKMAGKLGDYLHLANVQRFHLASWQHEMRQFLEEVYGGLSEALVGTLLGVPMVNPATGHVYLQSDVPEGQTTQDITRQVGGVGSKRLMRVRYLDEIPQGRPR